jgi:hypothetical protein
VGEILRLWAINAADAAALFAAPPELADRLRAVTRARFPLPAPTRPKFGPLTRQGPHTVRLPAGRPTLQEADALLSGQAVPADRVTAAWTLVEAWLDEVAAPVPEPWPDLADAPWQPLATPLDAAGRRRLAYLPHQGTTDWVALYRPA